MHRIIWVNGLIAGAIIIIAISVSMELGGITEHTADLQWLGYLVMIAALSLIFFGVKQFRDREQGGVIRFWRAFQVGLGITVVASLVYVVGWEINLALTDYRFIDEYAASQLNAQREAGASEAELAELTAEMDRMKAMYGQVVPRLLITFGEIFPVGLLIALISAAVLRRSEVLPAAGSA